MIFRKAALQSFDLRIAAVIFLICFICVSASSFIITSSNLDHSKASLMREVESIAAIISSNISASLAFKDTEHAAEVMATLALQESVQKACVYDENDHLFAHYVRQPSDRCAPKASPQHTGEYIVQQDVTNASLNFGTVYIFINNLRVKDMRDDALWGVALNLLFLLILLILPITVLIKRLIAKPVIELIHSTKLLNDESPRNGNNLLEARSNIQHVQSRLSQMHALLNMTQGQSFKLLKNFDVTLDIIRHDLKKNYDISTINKNFSEHVELDRSASLELFTVAHNEMSKFDKHFSTLRALTDEYQWHLSDIPSDLSLIQTMNCAFDSIFDSYEIEKFSHLKILDTNVSDQVYAYKRALESFANSVFTMFDYLCDYPNRGEVSFQIMERAETETNYFQTMCRLLLKTKDPISVQVPPQTISGIAAEEAESESADNRLINSNYCDDQLVYLIEALTFHANLNCTNMAKSVSITLLNDGVEINFIISSLKY